MNSNNDLSFVAVDEQKKTKGKTNTADGKREQLLSNSVDDYIEEVMTKPENVTLLLEQDPESLHLLNLFVGMVNVDGTNTVILARFHCSGGCW